MVRDLLSVRQAAEKTGRSEEKIRALISARQIEVVRFGYNILIPGSQLQKVRAAKYSPRRKD